MKTQWFLLLAVIARTQILAAADPEPEHQRIEGI